MKTKKKISMAIMCIISVNLRAEVLDPDLVFRAALKNDLTMKSLLLEKETSSISTAIEDHEDGISFKTGLNEAGTSVGKLGTSADPGMNVQPFTEIMLAESAGTVIRAEMPMSRPSGETDLEMSAALSIQQDINSLLGIEPQETAKVITRSMSKRQLNLSLQRRRFELEYEVLELTRSLLTLEKSIITNKTKLDEKETLLNNMLNAGMIARDSSNHLSNLMEIRGLENEAEELSSNYTAKLSDFERLTKMTISDAPRFPVISIPQIEPESLPYSIKSSELDLSLQKAELNDYLAAAPPELSVNAAGRQAVSGGKGMEISGGVNAAFEDFSLSIKGAWDDESGVTISAGFGIELKDKSLEHLNREILENNIETAALNLEISRQAAAATIRDINTEVNRIEAAEKSLKINAEFIRKYLDEMEIKYQHGIIREIELVKARDQETIIELDAEILNIDKYLLSNTISTQIESLQSWSVE